MEKQNEGRMKATESDNSSRPTIESGATTRTSLSPGLTTLGFGGALGSAGVGVGWGAGNPAGDARLSAGMQGEQEMSCPSQLQQLGENAKKKRRVILWVPLQKSTSSTGVGETIFNQTLYLSCGLFGHFFIFKFSFLERYLTLIDT